MLTNLAQLQRQLRRSTMQQLIYANPEAAMALLGNGADSMSLDFDLRAPLASRMIESGRKEDGLKLIDRTIADFAAAKPDPLRWSSFGNFLQTLPYAAPDRFVDAFQVFVKTDAASANIPGSPGVSLKAGDLLVPLDQKEAMALNVLRSISQRPELMLKALETMPSLKSKVEQAGGIDNALNSAVMTEPNLYRSPPPPGMRRASPYLAGPGAANSNHDNANDIYTKVRGKLDKEPQFVRRTLADAVTAPDDVQLLLRIAMMSSGEDPDLSCLCVELARPFVLRVESPQRRMGLFQQLVGATRQCEGEVDADLIKEGFILADDVREAQKEKPANFSAKPGTGPVDQFELYLLSELARDNFGAAIRYARSLPEESMKLAALLGIVQACRQQ
jgi:hypothetical protein